MSQWSECSTYCNLRLDSSRDSHFPSEETPGQKFQIILQAHEPGSREAGGSNSGSWAVCLPISHFPHRPRRLVPWLPPQPQDLNACHVAHAALAAEMAGCGALPDSARPRSLSQNSEGLFHSVEPLVVHIQRGPGGSFVFFTLLAYIGSYF